MKCCPYCNHPMEGPDPHRFDFSAGQRVLYNYILRTGREGVDSDILMSELLGKKLSPITLRTRIYGINKKIAPMAIVARGKKYRIEKI